MKENYDIVVVGGGINGCGIARDAAMRGYKVLLCEAQDLASSTSSYSSKLIHGGLRYLEHGKFKLVRDALAERETLLNIAPHVIWPLRFILPHSPDIRPAWMIRIGMFLYDRLARRDVLPPTTNYTLSSVPEGNPLKNDGRAFEYSDCWVDDARFVILNAQDAKEQGATILTHTRLAGAHAKDNGWQLELEGKHARKVTAKVLINASGPWASKLRANTLEHSSTGKTATRLVQGSHIVLPRLYEHDKAYILQNDDKRIVFALPFLGRFTLVGTTDREYDGDPRKVRISKEESDYLLRAVNRHFRTQSKADDIVWSYSGVRGLFDDGASDAQEVTRDYVIKVDKKPSPLINIFGGKLTTYRKLAEIAVDECQAWCPSDKQCLTATKPLPGGDFAWTEIDKLSAELEKQCADLPDGAALRLARAYGTRAKQIIGKHDSFEKLGKHFGGGLSEAEVRYLIDNEWASNAEDILWRRSKLGLFLSKKEQENFTSWIDEKNS